MNSIETTEVISDLHPLIKNRWSPRSFSERPIEPEQMHSLLEAARWAPSANNEQPWLYAYAIRGTERFKAFWECLMPGNQPWAANAAVLFVSAYRKTFQKNGKANPWAMHDVGLANAQLLLQALDRDIYGHMMAGFNKELISAYLHLDEDVVPLCVGALGYLGEPGALEEPYLTRETAVRVRKTLEEIII